MTEVPSNVTTQCTYRFSADEFHDALNLPSPPLGRLVNRISTTYDGEQVEVVVQYGIYTRLHGEDDLDVQRRMREAMGMFS